MDTPKSVVYERLLKSRERGERFDVSDKDFESTDKELEVPTADENLLVFHFNDSIKSWIDTNLRNKEFT